jgi:hypothetical protein
VLLNFTECLPGMVQRSTILYVTFTHKIRNTVTTDTFRDCNMRLQE